MALRYGCRLFHTATVRTDKRSLKHKKLVDATYTGYKGGPNKADLKLTMKDNTIVHIQIGEQWALRGKDAERV